MPQLPTKKVQRGVPRASCSAPGLNPHYQESFGTSDHSYYEFTLGNLWESYNMDSAENYPTRFETQCAYSFLIAGQPGLTFKDQGDSGLVNTQHQVPSSCSKVACVNTQISRA